MWDRRSEFLENHDGDTVKMKLDQGFDDTKTISVRLLAVYAPELHEVGGSECQKFMQDWFAARVTKKTPWNFITTTIRMKVADHEQKTLDRYVATVTSMDVNDNLNLAMMQFISSKGYKGGIGS